MKIEKDSGEFKKFELNMTPMIDACFLLIVFFMLTLRLLSPEGDFSITMPLTSPRPNSRPFPESPPIKIRLAAHPDGKLASIQMGLRKLTSFAELHNQIREVVALDRSGPAAPNNAEIELDCDYNLKYEYVVEALNAVSGYVANDKQTIVRMIEKVRFAPPRNPPEAPEGGKKEEGEKPKAGGAEKTGKT